MQTLVSAKVLSRLGVVLCLAAAVVFFVTPGQRAASPVAELNAGKVQLQSANVLAFGPDGILFVADSMGGKVVALDTNDRMAPKMASKIDVQGVDSKVAALLGTTPDQIIINDLRVNPISKNAYMAVSRGKGPDAAAVIVKIDGAGKLTEVSLDNVKNASVNLSDAPTSDTTARRNPRMQTVTDMEFVDGKLLVSGLSNEEWASALRSIPFPFSSVNKGTNIQIWHASHGRFETAAPINTFVPYSISGQQYILAAYTCTPLVKIPMSDLKPGAQVKPATIADVGAGNTPIDMVPYKKDGHQYILIANTNRGVMKLQADNMENYKAINSPDQPNPPDYIFGMHYDTISELKGTTQLSQLDGPNVVVLAKGADGMNVSTVALP